MTKKNCTTTDGAQTQAPDAAFFRSTPDNSHHNGAQTQASDDGTISDEAKYLGAILSCEKAATNAAGTFYALQPHHFQKPKAGQIFLANRVAVKSKQKPETVLAGWIAEGGSTPEVNQKALDLIPVLRATGAKIENPLAVADELAAQIVARWNEKNPSPKTEKKSPAPVVSPREVTALEIPAPSLVDDKGNPEYDPAQLVALLHPSWPVQNLATHAAHAQRICELIGADLCYSPNLGWLVYDGRFWHRDDKHATKTAARVAKLTQAVRDESATLYGFAATLAQAGRVSDVKAMTKAATALLRHTKQVESKAFIEGALHLAAGLLAVETERFDQKPWLIGFQNGTWDKGIWREHRREDYLLHLSPVQLDFEADRAEWLATLDRITGGDLDLSQAAQDMAGYIFSGASHLRKLPWLCGPKGTGKSTFAELCQCVLGDSAATVDPKNLQDSASRERAGVTFWNRKLVVCGEAGNAKLSAELLKTLSGADKLTVRYLFHEPFTAPPRHVLLMVSNDSPKMDAYDNALKDRVIALPFVHPLDNGVPLELTGGKRIEAVRQDPESPLVRGFAAWAMEGLARVMKTETIHHAACIETATAKFWADTDQLTPFWKTIEEAELLDGIGKTELRRRYETWCETEGARPKAPREWTRACKDGRGLEDKRRTGGKFFWYLPLVTKVTKQTPISNSTREEGFLPHGQFENTPRFVTFVTNSPENSENSTENAEIGLEEVEL
jgi:P4 family phage/plasmid primase-like protien